MKNKRTTGIVFLVLGVLAIIGAMAEDSYAKLAQGVSVAEFLTILLIAGLVIGGLVLIITGKKKQ